MSFKINVAIDPVDMAKVQLLNQWTTTFAPVYEGFLMEAGLDSLKALHLSAENHMWTQFQNPTGQLEDSLEEQMFSPYEGHLATNMPYARRRHWGFSGMTDSLGRYYAHDPGIYYFDYAIQDMTPEIIGYYQRAFAKSLAAMGVP